MIFSNLNKISKVYIGDSEVKSIHAGNETVYSSAPPISSDDAVFMLHVTPADNLTHTFGVITCLDINWGDGTFEKKEGQTSIHSINLSHKYEKEGDYEIVIYHPTKIGPFDPRTTMEGNRNYLISKIIQVPPTLEWDSTFAVTRYLKEIPDNLKLTGNLKKCFKNSGIEKIGSNVELISDSYTSIFEGCTHLKTISSNFKLSSNSKSMDRMFYNCNSLTSIPSTLTIPQGVTDCSHMFYNCNSLTSIPSTLTIPQGVTDCSYMFNGCSKLTSIPETLTIPQGVTNCSYMFEGCSKLTSIPSTLTIPQGVTNCGSMFEHCNSLTSIPSTLTIPQGVTNCSGMFWACYELTLIPETLTLPSSVTDCSYMFFNCIKLTSIPSSFILPQAVTNVQGLFGQTGLREIPSNFSIPDGVVECGRMFYHTMIKSIPDNITFPSSCSNADSMFAECDLLESISPNFKLTEFNKYTSITSLFQNSYNIRMDISDFFPDGYESYSTSYIFQGCEFITGTAQGDILWRSNYEWGDTTSCFEGCVNLTNYEFIPKEWGGLGKKEPNAYDKTVFEISNCDGYFMNIDSLQQESPDKAVEINWGDGTIDSDFSHQYWGNGPYNVEIKYASKFKLYSNPRVTKVFQLDKKLTDLDQMFYECTNLSEFGEDFCIHENVENLHETFYGCTSLSSNISSIFPSKFQTNAPIWISSMFYNCNKLTGFAPPDLLWYKSGNWIFSSWNDAFYGCENLINYSYIPGEWGGGGGCDNNAPQIRSQILSVDDYSIPSYPPEGIYPISTKSYFEGQRFYDLQKFMKDYSKPITFPSWVDEDSGGEFDMIWNTNLKEPEKGIYLIRKWGTSEWHIYSKEIYNADLSIWSDGTIYDYNTTNFYINAYIRSTGSYETGFYMLMEVSPDIQ